MNAIETLAADPADCAMMGEVLDTVREDSAMMVFPFQRGPILECNMAGGRAKLTGLGAPRVS